MSESFLSRFLKTQDPHSVDLMDLGTALRHEFYPDHIHTNVILSDLLKQHGIGVYYMNAKHLAAYTKVKNNRANIIMNRIIDDDYDDRHAYFAYAMAHMFAHLIINQQWLTGQLIEDDSCFEIDMYNGKNVTKKQFRRAASHTKIDNEHLKIYQINEAQAEILTLSFLMPADEFDPLVNANVPDYFLAAEFSVDLQIIAKRKALMEKLDQQRS